MSPTTWVQFRLVHICSARKDQITHCGFRTHNLNGARGVLRQALGNRIHARRRCGCHTLRGDAGGQNGNEGKGKWEGEGSAGASSLFQGEEWWHAQWTKQPLA